MENKDDAEMITDRQILELMQAVRQKDPEAMLQLIQLYKEDIVNISKFIHMPKEDAVSEIIIEFLEYIQRSD
ncbi:MULTISPECIES: hypothetical protein [Paenibacillus]|uniref:Helix-turn-helix conjugative transposon-like domain-containing protein n=1 Tax=Paenibacillus borealis TaxID=160799 RepID=A0ABX3H3C9_PAEBO|nr:hypothetical protein [Paenibacillus borealis]OMD41632.1 hypothetical protein BSK56_27010 [Paenibacillus borealis]